MKDELLRAFLHSRLDREHDLWLENRRTAICAVWRCRKLRRLRVMHAMPEAPVARPRPITAMDASCRQVCASFGLGFVPYLFRED